MGGKAHFWPLKLTSTFKIKNTLQGVISQYQTKKNGVPLKRFFNQPS